MEDQSVVVHKGDGGAEASPHLEGIEKVCGIVYCIKNLRNGKKYIGQTLSHLYKAERWEEHGPAMRMFEHWRNRGLDSRHTNQMIIDMAAMGIYEFEVFQVSRIPGSEIDKLDQYETDAIQSLGTLAPAGYNEAKTGSVLSPSKELLLKHYGKVAQRSQAYTQRQGRRMQKTLPIRTQQGRIQFFADKSVESVKLTPIKHCDKIAEIRVIIDIGEKDTFRVMYSKKDFQMNLKLSLELANAIAQQDRISIHPSLSCQTSQDEPYKYNAKLEEISKIKAQIIRIRGKCQYHAVAGNDVYMLYFHRSQGAMKRMSIGGKRANISDSFADAQEFVSRLDLPKTIPQQLEELDAS